MPGNRILTLPWSIALVALTATLVASDLRARLIPNWAALTLAGLGIALGLRSGGAVGAWHACLGLGAGGALLLGPYALGWLAAGDVKAAAALGAWLGPAGACRAVLLGLALGGLGSAAVLLARRLRHLGWHVPGAGRLARARSVPLGVALCGGAALVVLEFP